MEYNGVTQLRRDVQTDVVSANVQKIKIKTLHINHSQVCYYLFICVGTTGRYVVIKKGA